MATMDRLHMRLVRLRLHRVSNPGVNCVHLAAAQTELNRAGSYAATRELCSPVQLARFCLVSTCWPFKFLYNSSIFAQSCHCFRPFSTVHMKGLLTANLQQRVDNGKKLAVPLCVSKCSQDRPQDEGVGYPCSRCPWFYSKTPEASEASTAVEIIWQQSSLESCSSENVFLNAPQGWMLLATSHGSLEMNFGQPYNSSSHHFPSLPITNATAFLDLVHLWSSWPPKSDRSVRLKSKVHGSYDSHWLYNIWLIL